MKKFIMGLLVGVGLMIGTFAFADAPQLTATIRADFGVSLNGKAVKMDHSPVIVDGSMYLPLKDVAAIAGLDVTWDDQTMTAQLSTKSAVPPSSTSGNVGTNVNDGGKTNMPVIEEINNYIPGSSDPALKVDGVMFISIHAAADKYQVNFVYSAETNMMTTTSGKNVSAVLSRNVSSQSDTFVYPKTGALYIKESLFQ